MPIRDLSANKGEWAELYVLFRLLGDGRLYAADKQLNKKLDSYLDVLNIIREEVEGHLTCYSREGAQGMVEILVDDRLIVSISASEFLIQANGLFRYLEQQRSRAFSVPEQIADFSSRAQINKAKSPSVRNTMGFGGKSDIVIKLRDARNSLVSTMGFSIKSQFGSPATLFNASKSSKIEFELPGMTVEQALEFNLLFDEHGRRNWAGCIDYLSNHSIRPRFSRIPCETFEDNLVMIRDSMPSILAWLYRESMLIDRECRSIPVLCKRLQQQNPLCFSRTDTYDKAVKDFLFDSFSGMTAARRWDGQEQVNGGYIVVKPDGEVLCYHSNDREEFRDYLFRNTHLEYVDCKKFKWSFAYQRDGKTFVEVDASVRFNSVPR